MSTLIDSITALPREAGIYAIVNTIAWKCYVGQATKIRDRAYTHARMLYQQNHHSQYLQNAYNKYGEDAFIIVVIELEDCKDKRTELEVFWYHALLSEYNGSTPDGSAVGRLTAEQAKSRSKRAEETFEKTGWAKRRRQLATEYVNRPDVRQKCIAARRKPEVIAKHVAAMQRTCNDPAWKKKHSMILKASFAKQSEEKKAARRTAIRIALNKPEAHEKLMAARARQWQDYDANIFVISPDGKKYHVRNIKQFAEKQGLSYKLFYNVCSRRTKCHKGWTLADS